MIPDLSTGKTIQDKARKLNAKGATIQVIDADAFGQMLEVSPDEALMLIRGGAANAEAFAQAVADPSRQGRRAGPGGAEGVRRDRRQEAGGLGQELGRVS